MPGAQVLDADTFQRMLIALQVSRPSVKMIGIEKSSTSNVKSGAQSLYEGHVFCRTIALPENLSI